jgi:ATP-dependent Lon protease
VAQRNPEIEEPGPDDLYRVGTVAMVMRTLRLPDGRVKALVQGLTKARIDSFVDQEPSSWGRVSPLPADEDHDWCVEAEALMRTVRGRVEELLPLKNLPPEVISVTANVEEPGRLADLVASHLRLRLPDAQEVLEAIEPLARLRKVDAILRRELEVSSVQAQIQSQAKEEMTRGQREHFLREQLRAIQTELGEVDARIEELDEYRLKIEEACLPEEAHSESLRQLRRLERMHPDGPEAQVVRGYLDVVADLPRPARSAQCTLHPGWRPRPSLGNQGPHPRVPGCAQAPPRLQGADPLLRRPPRSRQDLPRPLHRACHGS